MTYLKIFRLLLLGFEVPHSPQAKKISKLFAKVVLGFLNLFTTHEKLSVKYLKKVKSIKGNTKKVGVTAFRPGVKVYEWRRELFEKTVELPFEWRTVTCPENYHERLSVQYGEDYMVFKKGTAQHTTIHFDPDKPYQSSI